MVKDRQDLLSSPVVTKPFKTLERHHHKQHTGRLRWDKVETVGKAVEEVEGYRIIIAGF